MNYCNNCGNNISQESNFCSTCGNDLRPRKEVDTVPLNNVQSTIEMEHDENIEVVKKPIYKRFWFWFWVCIEILYALTNPPDKIFVMCLIPWVYFVYNYLFDWIANLFARMNRTIALIILILLVTFLIVAKSIL